MLPVLTIVGRPNVGKSTLFNRLTRTRDAIVGDTAGITRDRQYGEGMFDDRRFIVVDTGGIAEVDDTEIGAMTEQQVDAAIAEANVVLFVVDAKAGLVNGDYVIAQKLRALKDKKVIVLANKVDSDKLEIAANEFYALGFQILYSISANNGYAISEMLTAVLSEFPIETNTDSKELARRTRVAVLGRPNVGKSTLINRIFGEERVIVFDRSGTTRDSIEIPYERNGKPYTLIDTAGIRRRKNMTEGTEIFSVIKAMQAMRQADVVIMVIDARDGLTEQDMRLLGLIIETGNALILAFNKWDGMSIEDREHLKSEVDRKLPFAKFARRYFISAKHGTGVGNLYDAIEEIERAFSQSFNTHELTEILMHATEVHQPPLAKGRRVKLRYAHVGSLKPLSFVIHGKQVDALPGSYKQFLASFFREKLKLVGIPLILKFLSDDNPFVTRVE